MIRGIETAAAGMTSFIQQNDIIANNMVNANTPGYKEIAPVFKSIYDEEIQEKNKNDELRQNPETIGYLSAGSAIDQTIVDFSQGPLKQTSRTLDVALQGEGFFVVETKNGEMYTRNGSFNLDNDGNLVTMAGAKVLDPQGRAINIDITSRDVAEIKITEDGKILNGEEELGSFRIVDFENKSNLKFIGDGLFQNTDPKSPAVDAEKFTTAQGFLETSNSNIVKSMINSISANRTYETLSKILQTSDGTLKKNINEVGAVR